MSDLLKRFQEFINSNHLFQKDNLLIIATSGGADSSALCELCYCSGFRFEIAHCNFQLRGEESTRDEKFVESLAVRYNAPFHLFRFDTGKYASEMKVGTQVAARELRYDWFDKIVNDRKNSGKSVLLLTAHHQDDSVETMLMHFFQGTGIQGLRGIPARNGYIARPLLFAAKNDILNFMEENNLPFVTDSSNLTTHYTRNYFRNILIPEIEKIYKNVSENLAGNLDRFSDAALLYDLAIRQQKKRLIVPSGNEIHLPVNKLIRTPAFKTVLFEIISEYGFGAAQVPEVIKLLQSDSGKLVHSSTHRILKNRGWLIIAPQNILEVHHMVIEADTRVVQNQLGKIRVEMIDRIHLRSLTVGGDIALLDASAITFPLIVRPVEKGDYFYPMGMNKKKKISRFLIDNKLSLLEKEKIQVVEMDKKIVWIVGQRIDNRFKVTEKTQKVLKLQFFPKE